MPLSNISLAKLLHRLNLPSLRRQFITVLYVTMSGEMPSSSISFTSPSISPTRPTFPSMSKTVLKVTTSKHLLSFFSSSKMIKHLSRRPYLPAAKTMRFATVGSLPFVISNTSLTNLSNSSLSSRPPMALATHM
uniref:Uncharacterized protein n=1 Tax=Triticum urartu TaxID=4572 RepID=A0A8R7JWK1_TRIUA